MPAWVSAGWFDESAGWLLQLAINVLRGNPSTLNPIQESRFCRNQGGLILAHVQLSPMSSQSFGCKAAQVFGLHLLRVYKLSQHLCISACRQGRHAKTDASEAIFI